jgi:hypothetical protein
MKHQFSHNQCNTSGKKRVSLFGLLSLGFDSVHCDRVLVVNALKR